MSVTGRWGPVLRGLRARQWVKNLLVLAAPLAAAEIFDLDVLLPCLALAAAFCAAASALYAFNDVFDREADRLHPTKRHRPVASGELTVGTALIVAAVLAITALAIAALVNPESAALVGAYLVIGVSYSLLLKHEPVLDLVVVASGFLMRAVGGGLAGDLPLSQWFLLVSGFGSLFIVAGKRSSELQQVGQERGTRRSLVQYTPGYLRFVWGLAAGATVLSYCLWAFEQQEGVDSRWVTASIVPFVVAILRYAGDIDAGTAGEPEEIVWGDRVLQVLGATWVVLLGLGLFDG